MEKLQREYSLLAKEIRQLHSVMIDICDDNDGLRELYKGCQILFSPLIYKPEFLLIGYNPGSGYYKHHGKIVENFEPMLGLEYYLNKHKLGEQTKALFRLIDKENELINSTVKINFYPWATDNIDDFKKLTRSLPKDLSQKIYHNARVWNKKIIDIIEPKIVICEGFETFKEVEVLFEDKNNYSKGDNSKCFTSVNGMNIFGYKRNQGSILNKKEISIELKALHYE